MKYKKWQMMCFSLAAALCMFTENEAAAMNYETYLESWDSSWEKVVQNLPPGPGGTATNSYEGVTLNLAFACYNFSTGSVPNGLNFSKTADVATVVNYVHSQGGKVRMSFGGATNSAPGSYFISKTSGWPNNTAALAAGVVSVITGNNLDGVDFDIEDPNPSHVTAKQFATELITFLKDVRSALPAGKTMTITIPGQSWDSYWYYLATEAAAIPGLVDYINFMEYDIWLNDSTTYSQQITADLLTYTSSLTASPGPNDSPGWGIPAGLIQLGLMPGCDDSKQLLTLAGAEALTSQAVNQKLYGVMTWDLNRDAGTSKSPRCSTYPSGYNYSTGIRNALAAP